MKKRSYILIPFLALWSTTSVAQDPNEANNLRVIEIDCDGQLSTFSRRVLRAVRQNELAVPTRPAIKDAFNELDVNSDGTIVSCEGTTLTEGCDHSLQMQAPNIVVTEFLGQGQADPLRFQCKGYLE